MLRGSSFEIVAGSQLIPEQGNHCILSRCLVISIKQCSKAIYSVIRMFFYFYFRNPEKINRKSLRMFPVPWHALKFCENASITSQVNQL